MYQLEVLESTWWNRIWVRLGGTEDWLVVHTTRDVKALRQYVAELSEHQEWSCRPWVEIERF